MDSEIKEKGAARCVLCGKELRGHEIVNYRGVPVHLECASGAIQRQVENFDKKPLFFGAISAIVAVFSFLPLLNIIASGQVLYNAEPLVPSFVGVAIGTLIQSVGYYGVYKNFKANTAILCLILSIVIAIPYLAAAVLLVMNESNPVFYNEVTGVFMYGTIPGMLITLIICYGLVGLLMVFTAIMVFMLEDVIVDDIVAKVVAFILIVVPAFIAFSPFNALIELFVVAALFLMAGPPKEWTQVEDIEYPSEM